MDYCWYWTWRGLIQYTKLEHFSGGRKFYYNNSSQKLLSVNRLAIHVPSIFFFCSCFNQMAYRILWSYWCMLDFDIFLKFNVHWNHHSNNTIHPNVNFIFWFCFHEEHWDFLHLGWSVKFINWCPVCCYCISLIKSFILYLSLSNRFLLILNRTGRRSSLQTTLLVLYLVTSFPTALFKILRCFATLYMLHYLL